MIPRHLHRMARWAPLVAVVSLVLSLARPSAGAQYCIGSTAYTVRDPAGPPMSPAQMRRLEVIEVNGQPARRVSDGRGGLLYTAPFRQSDYRIPLANPMELADLGQCGEIQELVLRFEGQQMRLRFGVPHHNTRYHFDSLPFQQGSFRVTGSDGRGPYPCDGNQAPPLIDNEHHGECRIDARHWHPVRSALRSAPRP